MCVCVRVCTCNKRRQGKKGANGEKKDEMGGKMVKLENAEKQLLWRELENNVEKKGSFSGGVDQRLRLKNQKPPNRVLECCS